MISRLGGFAFLVAGIVVGNALFDIAVARHWLP
jgi:hypothetical protein